MSATFAQAGRDVCLFAQYEPGGRIPPTTQQLMQAIAACGYQLHVACSGTDAIAPQDAAFLAGIGATGHARANAGLDFGAWQHLLHAGCAQGARAVLLANDSVFGPFGDLRPILAAMQARGLDAWGMVQSDERVRHLQSWFLWLSAAALRHPSVQRVLAQDFAAMTKEEVILHGELGLSTALREAGFALGSAWPARTGWRRLIAVNPSHFDWLGMLRSGTVPFVKAELLRENPVNLWWLRGWQTLVTSLGGDAAAIHAVLAARAGNAGPFPPRNGRRRLHRLVLNTLLTRDAGAALLALLPFAASGIYKHKVVRAVRADQATIR